MDERRTSRVVRASSVEIVEPRTQRFARVRPLPDPSHRGTLRVAFAVLVITGLGGLLSACGGPSGSSYSPPSPSPSPTQTYNECVAGGQTAVDRAAADGLTGVDVSVYDTNKDASYPTNGFCMTTHERDFVDELAVIEKAGQPASTLQAIVNTYGLVGPATVQALKWSWAAYQADHAQNPSLVFFARQRLGWVPLDKMTGVSMPGDAVVNPTFNPSGVNESPYTPSQYLDGIAMPDWNDTQGVIESWLQKFTTWSQCPANNSEDSPVDAQSTGDFLYSTSMPAVPKVLNGTPARALIQSIDIRTLNNTVLGTFNMYAVKVYYERHPDDRDLIAFAHIFYTYAHLTPDPSKQTFSQSDLDAIGITEGKYVTPGQLVGYVSPDSTFPGDPVFDLTIFTSGLHDYGAKNPSLNTTTLDPFASKYIAKNFGKTYAATPTQPRYEDDRVWAPCLSGQNVPDTFGYTP